jgi:carboxyl-terminal processing protease
MKLTCPSRTACTMVLGTSLLVASTIFAQQVAKPSKEEATTARLVCNMITRYHIGRGEVGDEISEKLTKRFVETLDPQKLYFLRSDIAEFATSKKVLDDKIKEGDVTFAFEVFKRYSKRAFDRLAHARKMVDIPHDFTVDEEMTTDGDSWDYAIDDEEANDRWRKRVKYDMLTMKIDDEKPSEIRKRLTSRYNALDRSIRETESSEIFEMYLSGLTHCFDPHSSYMSPQTLEEFRIQMKLSLDGIGAALRSEDGYTFVASIVKGGAADKDGRLAVGDKIIGVAKEGSEFVNIVEMKLSKVVRLIRGERGSKVRLQVVKAENDETIVYDLIRRKIELQESAVKGEIIQTQDRIGRASKIGVVNIPSFYRDFSGAEQRIENFKSTARDLQKVLMDFRDQGGVDAVIVDLRYNGGGALSEAIDVTGLFIDQGPVVQVKAPDKAVKVLSDENSGAFNEPLIVICNRMSASASEIFAGAIKDYKRGIVIGDSTTHGKGTVQEIKPVSAQMFRFFERTDRGALKLTINQFYRVNGDSTQNLGVKSDIVLPSLIDNMDIGESSLDNALAFDRIDPASFEKLGYVNDKLLKTLGARSAARTAKDEDLNKVRKDIGEYLERKNRKSITLNEKKLREERKSDKKDDKDKDKDKKKDEPKEEPVLPKSGYNDELLNIAADYVELLEAAKAK